MNNLKRLDIYSNPIEAVPTHAFHFKKDSNQRFEFYLTSWNFSGSSFQFGSLSDLKRPTDLHLGYNHNMTYSNEKIFEPFLETNVGNKIFFKSDLLDHFDCDDCRYYWLIKEQKYNNHIVINELKENIFFEITFDEIVKK